MELKSGTLLQGGKYRIIKSIGRGGFGITYLAEQVMAERKVCIKEFFPKDYYHRDSDTNTLTLTSNGFAESMNRFKAKFIKEAQTIANLDHANIIHIHDVFEENDTAYYVMEYIEGGSLHDIVKERGALPESLALKYIRDVALALDHIHEQSINHLDVKPGNIMVRTKGDSCILIDFGLSKHYDAGGNQTSSTPVGVSHGFAPFEQYKSGGVKDFSPSTDIYSLGATLYYLVTGTVPPSATDMGREGVEVPSNLSLGVQRAIRSAMNYWREDRPQSIDDFLKLLDDEPEVVAPIAENTIIDVEPKHDDESTIISVEPTQTAQPAPQPKNEPKPKNKRKSKKGLWLGIFLFVLVAVAWYVDIFEASKLGSPKKEKPIPVAPQPIPEPILESDSEVILPSDGGSGEIKYTITNPVDGESVEYTTVAEWLTLNHNDGVVSCTAQANTTGEKRSTTVTLTYCDQSVKVNISQDSSTPPNNEIWYTSSDVKVVKPYKDGKDIFGAEIESNTYKDGKGIIKFKDDVTTIGEDAFNRCISLTSVTIPNSVTEIGNYAFYNCKNLISVTIPDSVTAIGEGAFSRCESLTSVPIPNSVTTIGKSAFDMCSSLTSITIPNSVTTIGEWAFYCCVNLTSVTIPDSVTTIGELAFSECISLTSVTIPNSVTEIGNSAFGGCCNLKEFKGGFAFSNGRCLIINCKLVAFAPAGITEFTIPDSVATIGDYAFISCSNLTSVTISDSVTTIGEAAFYGCDNLTGVTIQNGVTTIGEYAFSECDSLTSVTIPNSVTEIGNYAFSCCYDLESVTIPDSVTTIGEYAFLYCDNLSEETKKRIKSINRNAL